LTVINLQYLDPFVLKEYESDTYYVTAWSNVYIFFTVKDMIDDILNKKCIRFCHGDCIEGMSTHIQEKSVDMVATSPPYNIGVKYGAYNDSLERNEYLEWIDTVGIAV